MYIKFLKNTTPIFNLTNSMIKDNQKENQIPLLNPIKNILVVQSHVLIQTKNS